jgi:Putative beta-lactamase-inhibitor-like, PepSY-like
MTKWNPQRKSTNNTTSRINVMKSPQILILTATVLLPLAALAQDLTADQVPSAIKEACKTRFPTVKAVAWKLKSDKNYEAEFTLKGTEIAAKFDSAGKWLETESAISRSKLPKAVRTTAAKQFAGYKVVETQTVQRWNEESLIYELHLENAKEVVKAQLSRDGALLNQSATPKPDKPAKRKP